MHRFKPLLLVEDDLIDVMTLRRAMVELGISNTLVHCRNGEEAMRYLSNESNAKPCLIFLDLNMPKMNGIEFIEEIKSDGIYRQIPIVVLTTSDNLRDIAEAFEHSVAGYMLKPNGYTEFVKTVRIIRDYWGLSKLPNGEESYERSNAQNTFNRG